jgi:hypothetical protein
VWRGGVGVWSGMWWGVVCVRIYDVMLYCFFVLLWVVMLYYSVLCGIIWCLLAYVILRLFQRVTSYLTSLLSV